MKTLKVKSILFSLLAVIAVAVFFTSCEQNPIVEDGIDTEINVTSETFSGLSEEDKVALLENPELLESYLEQFNSIPSEISLRDCYDLSCSYSCGLTYANCMEGVYILRNDYYYCYYHNGGSACAELANSWIEAFDECMIWQSACLNGCKESCGGGPL